MSEDPTVVVSLPPSAPPPSAPLLFGNRYRPVALLGTGGMGSVYLARDEELGELVAVKVLRPELVGNPAMVERFRDEVRIARRVSSPLVARTHDLGEHEGRWFVTMEYVEGETLSARLRREGALPLHAILAIARDVCDGLSAVHAAGVVHRDLKPGNVLLSKAGRAVLTDFGIAVRTDVAGQGDASGTPMYTAPEQLAGNPVDARADVFSLGAMLYVMATARKPFPDGRTGRDDPPDPRRVSAGIADAFADVVMRAMAVDVGRRFQAAEAVKDMLSTLRPEGAVRVSPLMTFVRSIEAHEGRRVLLDVVAREDVGPLLDVARSDLVARLGARRHVRIVAASGDAEAVLSVRLSKHGDGLRLDVALRSHPDGYELWREHLTGPTTSLPSMVEAAANGVERTLAPGATQRREVASLPSGEVEQLVFEARTQYRAFWSAHTRQSLELLEKALVLAPDHPRVLAWCAAARGHLRFMDDSPVDAGGDRDRALAERAVALAPDLPEARTALAMSYMLDMRVAEAVPHFIASLELAPGLVEQRSAFARILQECGAVRPALALAESTVEADPTFTEPLTVVMRHHALRGRLDLAAETLARVPFQPTALIQLRFAHFCAVNRDRDRYEKQVARLDMSGIDEGARRLVSVMRALLAGDRTRVATLDRVPGHSMRRHAFTHQIRADVYAIAEDWPQCLRALEQSVALGLFDSQWFGLNPVFDPLRGTARFESLRRTVDDRALQVISVMERCLEAG